MYQTKRFRERTIIHRLAIKAKLIIVINSCFFLHNLLNSFVVLMTRFVNAC